MPHEYEGHYKTKHASNTQLNPVVAEKVYEKATEAHLSCASAFSIVQEASISPGEVGQAADLLEIKITQCQLGLFGHTRGRRNIVEAANRVAPELEQALRGGVLGGRLPCKKAWEIAEAFGLSKMEITAACEKLEIRLGPCQLGTF